MTRDVALFRFDASAEIGFGHATRCLALAEAFADQGWKVTFIVNKEAPSLVPLLIANVYRLRTVDSHDDEIGILRQEAHGLAGVLVLDHYQRDASFEAACRAFVGQILVLDDATGRDHDCDILVDAAAIDPAVYAGHVPAKARALTGPAYALIRHAFLARREEALAKRDGRPVKEILVSFGATDPNDATSLALDALDRLTDDIVVTVALSSQAPHLEKIRGRVHGRMRLALDADMVDLATRADVAIGAAGVSAYERALLGLPSILVTLVANQLGIAGLFQERGAAKTVGLDCCSSRIPALLDSLLSDDAQRIRLAHAAATLVDGQGAKRIVEALQ